MSSMFDPRSSLQMPWAWKAWIMVINDAAPSTMAASTTWPWPERAASSSAATMPKASNMPPPPKSPTRFSGGTGAESARPMRPQGAPDGDVVDVVTGHGRHRPVLTPARHAPVDQTGVAGEAGLGSDAQALGHTGPEAFDQPVGLGHQPEHELQRVGVLQVDAHRGTGSVEQVPVRPRARGLHLLPPLHCAGSRPLQPQHLRPGVGQHHARVGGRPDARQLNDLDPAQRSGAVSHRRIVTRAAHDGQAERASCAKLGPCQPRAPLDE